MATLTKLIFKQPGGSQDKYSLSREGEYTVGTATSCDITLEDSALEEEHGKLVPDETNEGRWFLQIHSNNSIVFLENNTMMAVTVDLRDGVQIGTPRALFAAGAYEEDQFGNPMYDVASDGRFLMVRLGMGSRNWRWVQNWDAELSPDTP